MFVLIIGRGIGGLCRAQGLRKAGIRAAVFEPQKHPTESLAGYDIHIDRHGKKGLKECLPASSWSRFEAASGHAGSELFFRDKKLQLLGRRDEASSRAVLRQRSKGVGLVVWNCERSCLRG